MVERERDMRIARVPATIAALGLPMCSLGSEVQAVDSSPLVLEAAYTGDAWRNVRGGLRRDGTYLENIDVIATLDAEQAFGLAGTTVSISGLHNNRPTLSDRIVGDLQAVSNIDTDGATRLYEAWVERAFDTAAVRAGLMDLNSELDVNETGALFVNSSHGIGPDFSQVGENGPAIFPITGLGALLRLDLNERTQLRVAAFEGTVGDPDHPRRTTLDLESDEGALLVAEVTFRPTAASRSIIGLWRHSGRSTDLADPDVQRREASVGVYALAEGTMIDTGENALAGFVRVGFADADVHQVARYFGAGVTWSGPLFAGADREEQLGLAVAAIANGGSFRRAQSALGSRFERNETAIELTYRVQCLPWLALQPDVQYIINPGTDPALDNALVVGLRFELTWSNDASR
jgi:porin